MTKRKHHDKPLIEPTDPRIEALTIIRQKAEYDAIAAGLDPAHMNSFIMLRTADALGFPLPEAIEEHHTAAPDPDFAEVAEPSSGQQEGE